MLAVADAVLVKRHVVVIGEQVERIPDTVRDAVLARTAPLSPDARMLLDAAAVVPSRAELWLLEALAGAALGSLDECLASGILTSEQPSVTFRHELARLAIEGSIAANRKIELHRKALAVLAAPPGGAVDSARLAHHAEAAGDGEAVLRFSKTGDFELTVSKGPGITLLSLRQDSDFAEFNANFTGQHWTGRVAQAPTQLRGWLALREQFLRVPNQKILRYVSGSETFLFRF